MFNSQSSWDSLTPEDFSDEIAFDSYENSMQFEEDMRDLEMQTMADSGTLILGELPEPAFLINGEVIK